jgi:hypothetical protein
LEIAPLPATWQANGVFAIGRGGTAANPAERWIGGIDDVWALPRVWNDGEIDAAAHAPENDTAASAASDPASVASPF